MQMQTKSKSRLKVFLDNPSKALWSLAIPIMFGMGIQTLYNLVDMLFIGRLGGNAITGIAFNMPLFFLVLGLTMGLGTGVTAAIARFIGEDNKKQADNCAEHAVFIAFIISITLSSVGLLFGKDILSLFGASGEILNLGWEYLHVMCVGMPFMIFSGFFRSILAGEGDMKFPMMVAGLGTILNIILDPIFIFELESYGNIGFGLGISGAAMATVISQAIVFIVFIFMLFFKNHSYITFNLNDFSLSSDIILNIIKIGLPASLSMIVMAVGQGVFNKILVHISVETVAAYQVAGRLDMLVFLPIFSIAASLTTLIGMFYGAKEYEALRFTIRYGIFNPIIVHDIIFFITGYLISYGIIFEKKKLVFVISIFFVSRFFTG